MPRKRTTHPFASQPDIATPKPSPDRRRKGQGLNAHRVAGLKRDEKEGRARRAYFMRLEGRGWDEIAAEVGVSTHSVKSLMARGRELTWQRTLEETAPLRGDVRTRYQALIDRWYPLALEGDVEATKMVIRLQRELRDLLGLDAPKKLQAEIYREQVETKRQEVVFRLEDMPPEDLAKIKEAAQLMVAQREKGTEALPMVDAEFEEVGSDE